MTQSGDVVGMLQIIINSAVCSVGDKCVFGNPTSSSDVFVLGQASAVRDAIMANVFLRRQSEQYFSA